jgi:plasmid maintenance system antidote protein VapI
MDAIRDFEDMLELLHREQVQYLIIGGLAFIFHAKPRYTKDMDLWIGPDRANIERANRALSAFGSPTLLAHDDLKQVVQIGVEPNRIDLIVEASGVPFDAAWAQRITSRYGDSPAEWVSLDTLIAIKERIDHPRHQEDVRVLKDVKRLREQWP